MTEANANDRELSFLEHLVELRSRLLKACFAVLVVLIVLSPACWDEHAKGLHSLIPPFFIVLTVLLVNLFLYISKFVCRRCKSN